MPKEESDVCRGTVELPSNRLFPLLPSFIRETIIVSMGILRLFLALTVLIGHDAGIFGPDGAGGIGFHSLDGTVAVEAFFAISGFYMALILNEKYVGAGSTHTFYVNRFARICPVYWTITGSWVILEVLRYAISGQAGALGAWTTYGPQLLASTVVFLLGINLIIIGQDAVSFLQFASPQGALELVDAHSHPFDHGLPEPRQFLWNPPAWSISLELCFYLMAPILARRAIWIIALAAAASLLFKIWLLVGLRLFHDPYTYRFLPAELYLFLMGVLAYRCRSWLRLGSWDVRLPILLIVAYFAATLLLPFLPWMALRFPRVILEFLFTMLTVVMLPVIFHVFSRVGWDRALGELSYPAYLVHWNLRVPIFNLITHLGFSLWAGTMLTVVATIGGAYFFNRFLINPIEKWRQSYFRKRQMLRSRPADAPGAM